jgi:hypothetical protein
MLPRPPLCVMRRLLPQLEPDYNGMVNYVEYVNIMMSAP